MTHRHEWRVERNKNGDRNAISLKIMTGKCKEHIWGCCIATIKPHWGTATDHPEMTQDVIDEIERRLNDYERLRKATEFLSAEDADYFFHRIWEYEIEKKKFCTPSAISTRLSEYAKTLRGE